ncbi:hypothetical protein BASA81_018507 [Batrachochytrium salamandrivorans]|nr:hypothetical protein BASA81_018507 [Batrachochytrium salamandrivorans]
MDAELADRLNPLVKIPVPIKLRLADGDSSSMITHRTLPLQLHIGRHVETIGFYVTSLCHGIILGYSWWRGTTQVNWESRMVDFGSNYVGKLLCWVDSIQGLGKPPRTSDISPKISIPEPEPSNQTSDFSADPDIDLSLFKDLSTDLDLGVKRPVLQNASNASKSVSFAETIQAEVYPFLEASPISVTPIPPEINEEFSSVFSESQAEILPLHRSFDCTINLSSSAEPSYGRIYQLTREEDKQTLPPSSNDDELAVSSYDQRKSSTWAILFPNGTSMDPSKISAVPGLAGSEKDASDFAISGVLHQHDQSNTLRPVAFIQTDEQRRTELRYYDKELLAVVDLSSIGDTVARWSSSSDCLVRSQESGIFYVYQEIDSSTGSLVVGTFGILSLSLIARKT